MCWLVRLSDEEGNSKVVNTDFCKEAGISTFGPQVELLAVMNITYFEGAAIRKAFGDIELRKALNLRQAKEVIPLLQSGLVNFGYDPDDDDRLSPVTLKVLLAWARQHPTATFSVS